MNIKSILFTLLAIVSPIGLGLLLSLIFTGNATTYYIMFTLGVILLSIGITYSLAQKLNVTIDIYASDHSDNKSMLINNIVVGLLCAIPVSIIFAIFL